MIGRRVSIITLYVATKCLALPCRRLEAASSRAREGLEGCGSVSHTLWCGEVDDVSVALEHVDLLNGLDGLDIELLEGLLELLVVGGGPLGRPLHLPARGTLSTNSGGSTELLEALLDVGHLCEGCVWVRRRGGV